jgi:outer membrane beta-barrel protein
MRHHTTALALATAAACVAPLASWAQSPAQPPANPQVIVPEVDRRELRIPKIPSKDFEVGLFGGTYATQNFGASAVGGLRVGYHITEDFFVEAVYAATKVSDENFRQILPGGIFAKPTEPLKYYNVSAGVNVLPGEFFIGRNIAKVSTVYLIGGVGSTDFAGQKRQTFNVGFGVRAFLAQRFAVQLDMRDHIFPLDLLGRRETTQNLELTAGVTYFF